MINLLRGNFGWFLPKPYIGAVLKTRKAFETKIEVVNLNGRTFTYIFLSIDGKPVVDSGKYTSDWYWGLLDVWDIVK